MEAAYFHDALAALTLGDPARPLVFYCEANCWMSWNAARRAVAEGYTAVYWFPGGMQDWTTGNRPTPVEHAAAAGEVTRQGPSGRSAVSTSWPP